MYGVFSVLYTVCGMVETERMKIVYSRHAEDKLKREDIQRFGINKRLIRRVFDKWKYNEPTKYGAWATLLQLDGHTLRVVYAIIGQGEFKIITFHIAKKGRYEHKVLQRG